MFSMDARWFSVVGLVLDMIGALLIARGIFVTEQQAIELTRARWDANPPAAADRLSQSRLAQVGLAILVFGFLLQVVGTWPR